jgi:hypothetical protein
MSPIHVCHDCSERGSARRLLTRDGACFARPLSSVAATSSHPSIALGRKAKGMVDGGPLAPSKWSLFRYWVGYVLKRLARSTEMEDERLSVQVRW